MYKCNYYWLFSPSRGGIIDTPAKNASFEINIVTPDGASYMLNLFCDGNGFPYFARFTIPHLKTKEIPSEIIPTLQSVREHLLAVLRTTFRSDLALAEPSTVWSFTNSDDHPNTQIIIDEREHDYFNPESAKDLFVHSFNMRETFRLYIDGTDKRIPLQYRFLSYFKMIELKYRKDGRWKKQEIKLLLSPFSSEFETLGYNGDCFQVLHHLRDKCAHIKTGKNKEREVLGVTHLNHAEAKKISDILPLMRAICATVLNERAEGKFTFQTDIIKEDTLSEYQKARYSKSDPLKILISLVTNLFHRMGNFLTAAARPHHPYDKDRSA